MLVNISSYSDHELRSLIIEINKEQQRRTGTAIEIIAEFEGEELLKDMTDETWIALANKDYVITGYLESEYKESNLVFIVPIKEGQRYIIQKGGKTTKCIVIQSKLRIVENSSIGSGLKCKSVNQ